MAMSALIFVVTLPDQAAVLGVGIPYFTAILAATFPAENFPAERMGAARPVAVGLALFPFVLHKVKYFRRNDGRMAVLFVMAAPFPETRFDIAGMRTIFPFPVPIA